MNYMFVLTPKTEISRDGNMIIAKNSKRKIRVPVGGIEHLFLGNNATITTSALKYLNRNNKYVFMIDRKGDLSALCIPEIYSSNIENRKRQYKLFTEEKNRVLYTQQLLIRKADEVARVIYSIEKENSGFIKHNSHNSIPKLIRNLKDSHIRKIKDLAQARGVDGMLMKRLYLIFRSALPEPWLFESREYNPAPDPVNIVLSYVFTIFYSIMFPVLISKGYDPYLGFFHEKRGNHATLVSDIMEIARPELVRFCLYLFTHEQLQESDFYENKGKIKMDYKAGLVISRLFSEKILHSKLSPINSCRAFLEFTVEKGVYL